MPLVSNGVKKILGIILLFGGLAAIFYGIYSSYGIFTAKRDAPEIFRADEAKITSVKTGLEAQTQKLLEEQLKNLLPANFFPQLLNLLSWSIFAGILTFGGGQIAGLGIKLLK